MYINRTLIVLLIHSSNIQLHTHSFTLNSPYLSIFLQEDQPKNLSSIEKSLNLSQEKIHWAKL